ncbi:glycosyltransferase family 4 protein [Calidifontibacter terrae]
MHLLVDDRWTGDHGIARYYREVLSRLPMAGHPVRSSGDPISPRGLATWEAATLRAGRRHRGATLWSPGFTPAIGWGGPQAITVHDLIHLDVAAESNSRKRLYYQQVVRPLVRRSPVTFTVSEFSRQQLVQWSGVDPEQIVVTGNATDPSFRPTGPRFDPGFRYLLYVGNRKPHKNLDLLLRTLQRMPDDRVRLALSGTPDAALTGRANELGVTDRVHWLGRIADADLPAVYRGAELFVFPSEHEGFGIPAIEAMACGTPVLAADRTSLPEVVGAAGLIVDPDDEDGWLSATTEGLSNPALRADLAARGIRRAADFSWDTVAAQVVDGLRRLGG